MHEISFDYDDALIKKAARVGVKKHLPRLLAIFLISASTSLVLAFYGEELLRSPLIPDVLTSLLLGAFIGMAILSAILPLVLYFASLSQGKKMLKKFSTPEVRIYLGQDEFRFKSSISDSTVQWKAFQKLYPNDEVYLLFLDSARYFILPSEQLSDDLLTFLMERLEENDVKICRSLFSI